MTRLKADKEEEKEAQTDNVKKKCLFFMAGGS
jgi:hypothetical protein